MSYLVDQGFYLFFYSFSFLLFFLAVDLFGKAGKRGVGILTPVTHTPMVWYGMVEVFLVM